CARAAARAVPSRAGARRHRHGRTARGGAAPGESEGPPWRSAGGAGRDETDPLIEEHVMRSRSLVGLLALGLVALPARGRLVPQTPARIGKRVGARYVVLGTFIDFYGDFRVDARLVSVETSEIVKVEKDQAQRDHLFQIIQNVAGRLMKDANLPPLPKQASDQRMSRQIPTEALTYYSRALLYQDRGQKDKAVEMYQKALAVFPDYSEAQQGLQRVKTS